MRTVRQLIKTGGLLISAFISFLRRDRLPRASVLMYHGVEESSWKYGVDPQEFELQLLYLKENRRIVSLKEIVLFALGESDLQEGSVAITIDDGYLDTYTTVFPLLKKYSIPATIFLTTDLLPKDKLGNFPRPTWEQIQEMYESGLVTFEAHGHTHKNLTDCNTEVLSFEIRKSKEEIESHLGYSSIHFAYPAGNRSKEVVEVLKEHGFVCAFGIGEGFIEKEDNPFSLKRIQVDRTMSFTQFKLRLTNALEVNRKLVDKIRTL